MQAEVWGWLATGILAPIVAVSLSWALLVFHCHRKKWRPLDILFVFILVQIILKQCGAFLHTVLELLRPEEEAWCSGLSWLFTTSHTMEAGLLTTLSLGSLLQNRMDSHLYRRTFSKSHLIYHVTCLFILSTCIGVASVIAKQNSCLDKSDKRYILFWVTLQSSLIIISIVCFIANCCRKNTVPKHSCFNTNKNHCTQLLNSSSDLSSAVSDISMLSNNRSRINHGIRYSISDCSTSNILRSRQNLLEEFMKSPQSTNLDFQNNPDSKFLKNLSASQLHLPVNTLDSTTTREFARIPEEVKLYDRTDSSRCGDIDSASYSTIFRPCRESCYTTSTSSGASASSTNSRKRLTKAVTIEESIPLCTIVFIVMYCYTVHHFPNLISIILELYVPQYLPAWWKAESFPYWTAILEGMFFPIILLLVDKQFSLRIAQIYSRQSIKRKLRETPPDMTSAGIYGKFRPYNSTLLEAVAKPNYRRSGETVRFPITNGSLFASPHGRNSNSSVQNPNIHCKGIRTTSNPTLITQMIPPTPLSINSQLYANILTAVEINNNNCNNNNSNPSSNSNNVNVHKLSTKPYVKNPIYNQQYNSSDHLHIHRTSSNEHDQHQKSYNIQRSISNNEIEIKSNNNINNVKTNPIYSKNIQQFKDKFFNDIIIEDSILSDDDDESDMNEDTNANLDKNCEDIYATLSNHSLCSATTDANDDFEFYNSETNIEKYSNEKLNEKRNSMSVPDDIEVNDNVGVVIKDVIKKDVDESNIGKLNIKLNKKNVKEVEKISCKNKSPEVIKETINNYVPRQFYKTPINKNKIRFSPPNIRRLTTTSSPPPSSRRQRILSSNSRRLAPVLSMDSLIAAINYSDVSYLDTGDLYDHKIHPEYSGSVPDLKKIFVTDYL